MGEDAAEEREERRCRSEGRWGCCAVLCLLVCEFAGSRDDDPSLEVIARARGEARWRDVATRCGEL